MSCYCPKGLPTMSPQLASGTFIRGILDPCRSRRSMDKSGIAVRQNESYGMLRRNGMSLLRKSVDMPPFGFEARASPFLSD